MRPSQTGTLAGNYAFTHGFDAYGNRASLAYPSGLTLALNPNALDQPTQLGAYASAVGFHPIGQLAGYTAGNGVVFSGTQNLRGLPLVWRHTGLVADTYSYDG